VLEPGALERRNLLADLIRGANQIRREVRVEVMPFIIVRPSERLKRSKAERANRSRASLFVAPRQTTDWTAVAMVDGSRPAFRA